MARWNTEPPRTLGEAGGADGNAKPGNGLGLVCENTTGVFNGEEEGNLVRSSWSNFLPTSEYSFVCFKATDCNSSLVSPNCRSKCCWLSIVFDMHWSTCC